MSGKYTGDAAAASVGGKGASSKGNGSILQRIAICYGISMQKAVQIRDLVDQSGILDQPDGVGMMPNGVGMMPIFEEKTAVTDDDDLLDDADVFPTDQLSQIGQLEEPNHIVVSTRDAHSTPVLASTSVKGITENLTMADYVAMNESNRSDHDSEMASSPSLGGGMAGVETSVKERIYELLQLLRTSSNGLQRTESHIAQLVEYLAGRTWPVAAWCDTVYKADKTNRAQIRDKLITLPVRFVSCLAAESDTVTEQLYMVKRVPKDMIQNTGLRKRPSIPAPSNHGKVRNGAIVRIGKVMDNSSGSPVILDKDAKFVFIQLLSKPQVHGYIRLQHLHPYRLVNLEKCPDCLSGELRRKSGVLMQRCYFRLKSGVLNCYSDSMHQKLKCRYNLATVMYAYQGEKDDTLIFLKFKRNERVPSGRISIGKSVTLKARNADEARLWTDGIGVHCAWLNWQLQIDKQKTTAAKTSTYVSLQRLSRQSSRAPPPQTIVRPPAALKWTYDMSLFKQCYAQASAPNTVLEVLQPLNAMISLFTEMCDVPDHKAIAQAFYRRLENEIFEFKEAHKQVNNVCQRLWTSALRLDDWGPAGGNAAAADGTTPAHTFTTVDYNAPSASASPSTPPPVPNHQLPAELRLELCSIINRSLQKDGALSPSVTLAQRRQLLQHVAIICRGINTIRATGSDHANELVRAGSMYTRKKKYNRFPPGGVTWRGGGFCAKFKPFFVKGLKFRAPCYLATSFSKDVADDFRKLAASKGRDTIMWRIEVDPEGVTNPNRRCFQVNYVRQTVLGNPDEQEFLFSQFAPFQVKDVRWSPNPRVDPHRITLYALQDSRKEREDLPLSPWN